MLKDPIIRRFISSSLFAGTFVWVAISFFDVDPDVVWMLLGLCFLFVGALIVVGLMGVPLIRLIRPKPPFLSKIAVAEQELAQEKHSKTKRSLADDLPADNAEGEGIAEDREKPDADADVTPALDQSSEKAG
ncbi:MAG: hypothetical protein ACI8Z1_003626 [Candidatus Azotimanducaceae bacterium]|jgi:hypothetical protein